MTFPSPGRRMNVSFSKKKIYALLVAISVLPLFYFERKLLNIHQTKKLRRNLPLFGESSPIEPSQDEINYIANQLQVRYDVISNFNDGYFLAGFTFINTGSRPIPTKRWKLYFYCFRRIRIEYPHSDYSAKCGLKLFHFEGSLYWFEPVNGTFKDIAPGEKVKCILKIDVTQVSRTDSFPNWYVTGNGLVPRIISSTKGENLSFVGEFQHRNQYLSHVKESEHPYSAEERYNLYSVSNNKVDNQNRVIPTPLHLKIDEKNTLNWNTNEWVVLNDGVFSTEAEFAAEKLNLKIVAKPPKKFYIQFKRVKVPVFEDDVVLDEAYQISTNSNTQQITITADTDKGAFNGIQTLLSLVSTQFTMSDRLSKIPSFTVMDAPRFRYRGLHIDVARNFHGADQIKKTMEAMAMYKLNKLHLHLSDDEGWRLEIPGLPELIQIGSRRCDDPTESKCLMPMLGSGPYTNTSGSSYFDIASYRGLLEYAKRLHIQIIPEIDMPGHSNAAIKSIHTESAKSRREPMNVEAYNIVENRKSSQPMSIQNFNHNVLDPCMPETYKFVSKIMTEIVKIHDDIQPLSIFHFGADEVVKDVWNNSQACEHLKQQNPNISSHYDKIRYFVDNVIDKARAMKLAVGIWEDGVMEHGVGKAPGGSQQTYGKPFKYETAKTKDINVYVWKNTRFYQTPHRLRLLANYGYKVILSYATYLYFDHPYEADPEERGLIWATRSISLRKVWSFTPTASEQDIDLHCPVNVKPRSDCFELKKPKNIIGMQAQLWTETVRTGEQMDYMLFPRLLAVAERAWHKATWEIPPVTKRKLTDKPMDYADFISTVDGKELRRLDQLGIYYRVPPPGAIVRKGKVSFRTEFPSLEIEYYEEQENQWKLVSKIMPITKTLKIRTRTKNWYKKKGILPNYVATGDDKALILWEKTISNFILGLVAFMVFSHNTRLF